MDWKAKGEAMLAKIARVRELNAKREELLVELEQTAHLMVQGIDPATVKAYIIGGGFALEVRGMLTEAPRQIVGVRLLDGSEQMLGEPIAAVKRQLAGG